MDSAFAIVAGGVASLLLSYFNRTIGSPVLAIINRWLRWISASLLMAWLFVFFEFADRPFAVVAGTAFLLIFLLETLYNWLAISGPAAPCSMPCPCLSG